MESICDAVAFEKNQVDLMGIYIASLVRNGIQYQTNQTESGWIVETTGGF